MWFDDFVQDVRVGVRRLVKSPGYTLVAVLTLGIGLGASVTMFSFVNFYLLRPLPYPDSDRLAALRPANKSFGPMSVSYANFRDWQARNRTFDTMACFRTKRRDFTGADQSERWVTVEASANLLPMLGVRSSLGRLFGPADDRGGAPRQAVLTYRRWQRSFAADPNIVGRSILLDGRPYTIIGVLPQEFVYPPLQPQTADVWTPVGLEETTPDFLARSNHSDLRCLGKLKVGATLDMARADMGRVARELASEYAGAGGDETIVIDDFHQLLTRDIRPGLLTLMAAVGCVLLMVCVNLAGVCLVRAARREHELLVRSALGATRWAILRELFSETLLLTLAGGAAGLLLAVWGTDLLQAVLECASSSASLLADRNVAWFAGAVLVGSALLVGLLPAVRVSRSAGGATLRVGVRSTTAGRSHQRMRNFLVVAEFALALVILSGAVLLVRSYQRYREADPGYTPGGAWVMQFSLRTGSYATAERRLNLYHAVLDKMRSLPGVQAASLSSNLLGGSQTSYVVEGRAAPGEGKVPYTESTAITPDFFKAMGMRLLAGRALTDHDSADATPVAVVDERFAQRAWPHESAVGRRFQFGNSPQPGEPWYEVVGVVSHVKSYGVDQDSREHVYLSADQKSFDEPTLVLRTAGDPSLLADPARRALHAIDSNLATSGVRPLQAVADLQSFDRRFLTALLSGFAITAVLLAALGMYGVTAYAVSQRMREFGIRSALGATGSDVARLVLRQGFWLVALGSFLGFAGYLAVSGSLKGLIFGIPLTDPVSLAVAPAVLVVAALLACWLPARRATRVDPLLALHAE